MEEIHVICLYGILCPWCRFASHAADDNVQVLVAISHGELVALYSAGYPRIITTLANREDVIAEPAVQNAVKRGTAQHQG